jgi:type I restriction enzyme S subunit
MNTWTKQKFKDFAKLQRGFDLPAQSRIEGKYPVVASTSTTALHSEYKVKGPCVTTGRSGALGQVLYIKENCWPLNTTLWVKDFCGNDPKFVYFKLKTLGLQKFNAGAGVPTLNKNHLDTLDIIRPDLPTQQRIASVLCAYDDLIENNEKRIKILEEIAQWLYTEWFVKFKFPGHEKVRMTDSGTEYGLIPDEWKIGNMSDIFENLRIATQAGNHLASRRYVPIDCISRKSLALKESNYWKDAQSSLILFEKGDILFGAMRPYFHKVAIAPYAGVTRTTCFVLRPKNKYLWSFGVLLAFSDRVVSFASGHTKGATIPYAVWEGSLSDYKVVIPPVQALKIFEETIAGSLNELTELAQFNKLLTQMKDLLIPQLVTGKRLLK